MQDGAMDTVGTKDRTKKQIENAIMGGYQNLQSMKLSDFIDEAFLEDLVRDIDEDTGFKRSDKQPLNNLMDEVASVSSICLPQMKPTHENEANKRRKTVEGDIQVTHLVMTPLLALVLSQTDNLLNQDWRRRQVAACNLRFILSAQFRSKAEQL